MFPITTSKEKGSATLPRTHHCIAVVLVALALVSLVSGVRSQADDGYDLSWFTVDGGGGKSGGGEYALSGTIGQSDAGAFMAGGEYSLTGGFWSGTTSLYSLYLPLVLR
jgi:hypothetical protein